MGKISIPGKADINWAIIKGGKVEIWGQNVSSHPWKNRDYPPQLIKEVSLKEFEAKQDQWQENAKKIQAIEDEKERKATERQTWIKTLPDTVDGLTVDKTNCEVCDEIGNYLFSLPFEPVKDFNDWIKKEMDDCLEYGD